MTETLREKLSFFLMGGAMLSKSLIQVSVDGWGCVPSLLFDLRPNYGGGTEGNGTSFKKSLQALLHSVPPTLKRAITNSQSFLKLTSMSR